MGSSKKSSDKDKEKDKEARKKRRERSKERTKRNRSKSRERGRERSRSRERRHGRDRSRSRDRKRERSRSKERGRERSKSKERGRERSRSRDRKRERSRSKERGRERQRSKERGRERSRSRDKKRERGRNRSRSKERGGERARSKERGRERSKSRERKRSKERVRERSRSRERKKSSRREKEAASPGKQYSKWDEDLPQDIENGDAHTEEDSKQPAAAATTSGGDISLSIEETNKLRLSLGLKPLQVDSPAQTEGEPETATKKEDVHAPPKNMGEIRAAEKLKEKIMVRRETRKIAQALSSVKTLGQADGSEDASLWVTRMRHMDEEKKKAQKKAEMLAEMDEEFGIADLISDVEKEVKQRAYGAGALRGLKVEHDVGSFKEGREVTLVIKDSAVLEDSGDVLLNPNMVEAELAARNVELKKGKPGYNPYEDEEVDELGNVKKQTLLGKYDEEIHGEKKKAFVLGSAGEVDTEADREREIVRQRLQEKKISLEMPAAQIASEYYTSEEMVQFKKVKKKRKLRKVERVKADDLQPLPSEGDVVVDTKDHGSRSRGSRSQPSAADDAMDTTEWAGHSMDDLKDEADSNMTNALTRTRRLLKHSKTRGSETKGVTKVVDLLQGRGKDAEGLGEAMGEGSGVKWEGLGGSDGDTIILDTTAEFCKLVGEEEKAAESAKEAYGHHDNKTHDIQDEEMDLDEGGWTEDVKEHTGKKKEAEAADLYQEAEPLVASGVVATLQLATRKGFVLNPPVKKKTGSEKVAQTTTGKRDVEYERQKEKERDRELSRYGREGAFQEKKDYVPNVKIEHVDDTGRVMNIKEAFRYMSHKFHGRSSGRKKTEKRLKKLKQEKLLNSASSVDTPLNTLSVLKSKQKSAQSPYILVSGGAQSLLAPDIAKRK